MKQEVVVQDIREFLKDCYKRGSFEEQIANEGGDPYDIEGISKEETITFHIKGAMYGWKTSVDGEILSAFNQVKSLFIENIRLLTKKQYILCTILTFLSIKQMSSLLDTFNRLSRRVISPYLLKPEHLTPFAQELHFVMFTFLWKLGIDEEVADIFAETFTHMIEYDTSYRFRLSDILSETNNLRLLNPQKEIDRLISIAQYREGVHVDIADKYVRIAKLLKYVLYIPKVRKAFNEAIKDTDFKRLSLDDSDKYWLCMPYEYKYMGLDNEQRQQYAVSRGWTYPSKVV